MRGGGESECDQLIASLYGASAIIRYGRNDRSSRNTIGHPDRAYVCGARLLFWESKAERDVLSEAQIALMEKLLQCEGVRVGCGNRNDLLAMLQLLPRHDRATGFSRRLIAKWRTAEGGTSPAKALSTGGTK